MHVHTMRCMTNQRPSGVCPSASARSGRSRRTERDAANARRPGPRRRVHLRGRALRRQRRCVRARSCSTRRCRDTRRSSPTRATPGRSSRSPTRTSATTASTPPTSRPGGCSAGASSSASCRAGRATAGPQADLDAMLRRYGIPGITGIDTRRLTRLIRDTGAIPGAFGPADDVDAAARRGSGRAGHRRHRPRRHRHHARAVHGRRRRARTRSSPTTSASSGRSCAASPSSAGRGRPGDDAAPPTCSPAGPTASSCPTGPATRPRSRTPWRRSASCSARCPVFGICLGHQLLGRALGAETVKLPFGHHGANHPVKDLTTGRHRDHQPEPQLRRRRVGPAGGRRADPRQPQRRGVRGAGGPAAPGLLGAAPPRGRARPARQRVPVRAVRSSRDGPASPWPQIPNSSRRTVNSWPSRRRVRSASGAPRQPRRRLPVPDAGCRPDAATRRPRRRSSSSGRGRSSSARPASSTTPAPRPAASCATRATASSSSTPTRRRS